MHVCGFWVHVYGAVGCMYAVAGCIYMETLGCMSADFWCKYMERLGACMRLLGANYAVVGCKVCGCCVHLGET